MVAGEPLNPEVFKQFHEQTGIKLMEGYGQTECTVAVATYPWMNPKPGSMGMPTPGMISRLLMKMVIHVKQEMKERLLYIL